MAKVDCQLRCSECLDEELPGSQKSEQEIFQFLSPTLRQGKITPQCSTPPACPQEAEEEWLRLSKIDSRHLPILSATGWSITIAERRMVVQIIYKVISACQLSYKSQMLAVNIFDRYIAALQRPCSDKPLLLAIVCVQLAAKMEEIGFEAAYIRHILLCFSRSLNFKELAFLEAKVGNTIEWRLNACTAASLLEPLVQIVQPQLQSSYGFDMKSFSTHVLQLCATAYQEAYFALQRPSYVALAIVKVALLQYELHEFELANIMKPAYCLVTLPELQKVEEIFNCLSQMVQPPLSCRPRSAWEETYYHETNSTEESPINRQKAGQMTPSSILCLSISPNSDAGSNVSADSPFCLREA